MIVDDSASVRRVVGIALKGAGYTVIDGCDGRDASEKQRQRGDTEGCRNQPLQKGGMLAGEQAVDREGHQERHDARGDGYLHVLG